MVLPFFYIPAYDPEQPLLTLEEDASRHIVQVLKMVPGEFLQLTDGRGNLLTAEIITAHKKHCVLKMLNSLHKPRGSRKISIAVSLLKNNDRFEWFIEKAMEIGVSEIIPMICERTEKRQFRLERLKAILVSALIQSQRVWLPDLKLPQLFNELILSSQEVQKFIAHCQGNNRVMLADAADRSVGSQIILIGPEGDFTTEEISLAIASNFIPVSLGEGRLRSETAGVVAATLLKMR